MVTFDPRGNGRSDRPATTPPTPAPRSPRTPWPSWTRPAWSGLSWWRGATWATRSSWPPSTQSGSPAWSSSPRRCRPGRGGGTVPVRRGARYRGGLGQGEPALLATRLARLPGMVLLSVLYRAALHQAGRGLRRLGPGDQCRDHPGRLSRLGHQGARPGDGRRPVRPSGAAPGLRRLRHRLRPGRARRPPGTARASRLAAGGAGGGRHRRRLGVGLALLRRVVASFPEAARRVDGLRMVANHRSRGDRHAGLEGGFTPDRHAARLGLSRGTASTEDLETPASAAVRRSSRCRHHRWATRSRGRPRSREALPQRDRGDLHPWQGPASTLARCRPPPG